MVVGLTGSIGTGKSTVTNYLLSKGYPVIDSDLLAREIVAKGHPVLDKIIKEFGAEVLLPSGELDRKALGKIIFSDDQARKKLDAITHPAINDKMHELIKHYEQEGNTLIFCDIPLLYEGDMAKTFDEVWVVYVSPEVQLERLMARDSVNQEMAQARINAQVSIEKKKEWADVVIDNSFSKEDTYKSIEELLRKKGFC